MTNAAPSASSRPAARPTKDPTCDADQPTPGYVDDIYDYLDERGRLLFQVLRYRPKGFRQRRPDPKRPGGWIWNLDGVRPVLYNLPTVQYALETGDIPVFVCEGEKDADRLAQVHLVGTTAPRGAKRKNRRGAWSRFPHGPTPSSPPSTSVQAAAHRLPPPRRRDRSRQHSESVCPSLE
jgi:hypothetical protein